MPSTRITDRLPKLSLSTPPPGAVGYSGPGRILRVDVSPTRGSDFLEPRENVFHVRYGEVKLFFKRLAIEGGEVRTRDPKPVSCRRRHFKGIINTLLGYR